MNIAWYGSDFRRFELNFSKYLVFFRLFKKINQISLNGSFDKRLVKQVGQMLSSEFVRFVLFPTDLSIQPNKAREHENNEFHRWIHFFRTITRDFNIVLRIVISMITDILLRQFIIDNISCRNFMKKNCVSLKTSLQL